MLTMGPMADPFLLYRVNDISNIMFIIYVDDTLFIEDKPSLMDKI